MVPRVLCASFALVVSAFGQASRPDWLIHPGVFEAVCVMDEARGEVSLENGLVRRTWRLAPNAACVAFEDLDHDQSVLRSVRPEARVTVNGTSYDVGGLVGQPNHAYLTDDWIAALEADPKALRLVGHEVTEPVERLAWKRVRHHDTRAAWPPRGAGLRLDFQGTAEADTPFRVSVHYELYDGIPAFSKWITVENRSSEALVLDRFTSEELALREHANWVESRDGVAIERPQYLHVETDFAFGGFNPENANRHVVHWRPDPLYSTQVNYARRDPCLLVVEPTYGPRQRIAPGATFESFRTFELVHGDVDRERRGLARRKLARTVSPWVTENPLMHHMRIAEPTEVRRAIDQAADVGFEMIILSFGSSFDIEDDSEETLARWREVADHARERGIELGGYSLLSSRRIGGGNDIVPPEGLTPTHGSCPALTSEWGSEYFAKLYRFFEETGMSVLEHDGPYPGDVDVTSRLPHQTGIDDSRWLQWRITTDFYEWCRGRGIYVNAPDHYFHNGTNKCGMGYREVNWSLPRAQQVIHTRQNVYDGTWAKTPSMGWMFVPLTEYHGGGAAATVEPLDEHLAHYESMLVCNLGFGVQACYRGPRLFDTDRTRDAVRRVVAWFKEHREVLESDLIHGRRADGRDLDWMLHVNPAGEEQGMLIVHNPLDREVTKTLTVDLYYTGLDALATVVDASGAERTLPLDRDHEIDLEVAVPARGMAWYVVHQ